MNVSTAPSLEPLFHTREAAVFAEHYRMLQQQTGLLVPPRKAFSPSAARSFLPYAAILEIQGPGVILVRLVGTAVINRGRVDMTGRNLLDFYPPEGRAAAWQEYLRVLETPCGNTFLSREQFDSFAIHTEIVNFPLADETGNARFILGIAVETDRRELMMRGDAAMEIGAFIEQRYLDIGAGI